MTLLVKSYKATMKNKMSLSGLVSKRLNTQEQLEVGHIHQHISNYNYKIHEMCEKAVKGCLYELEIVSDWFVVEEMRGNMEKHGKIMKAEVKEELLHVG